MTGDARRCRVQCSFVRHTSMSVGVSLIDEAGHSSRSCPSASNGLARHLRVSAEFALHLLALGFWRKTTGWRELFEQDAALLAAAIVERLRNDKAWGYALAPTKSPHL